MLHNNPKYCKQAICHLYFLCRNTKCLSSMFNKLALVTEMGPLGGGFLILVVAAMVPQLWWIPTFWECDFALSFIKCPLSVQKQTICMICERSACRAGRCLLWSRLKYPCKYLVDSNPVQTLTVTRGWLLMTLMIIFCTEWSTYTFIVPRGWNLMTLLIPRLFIKHHHEVDITGSECNGLSTIGLITIKFGSDIHVPIRII